MNEYVVEIPFTGHMGVCIKAENKEDAIELALKQCSVDDIKEWFTEDENIQVREINYEL